MSTEIVALSLSGGVMCFIILAAVVMYRIIAGSKQRKKKTKAKSTTVKSTCLAKQKDCAYTSRLNVNGVWGCPVGWEDTTCDWKDGPDKGKLQCRACGPNNPYTAYQVTNPNCPAGYTPCNKAPFNYGDLKKNAQGEYYYDNGWGVDDPNYSESDMNRPYGGTILLNKGKFGGTDAHPEVFAKGCCAWGNSADDPERDQANTKIKKGTLGVSIIANIGAAVASVFVGPAALAASIGLTAASVGAETAGMIRAKCGGPTELYKKNKRSYIFKGPYKDGLKMRGSPGIWYTANDGCALKFIQYVPPNQRDA